MNPASPQELLLNFATGFVTGFVGSGLPLGLSYVLFTRAIRANRSQVEDWFEKQRVRLEAGSFRIISVFQPVLLAALLTIYGRSARRRLITSLFVALFFSVVILSSTCFGYARVKSSMRERKSQIMQEADPKLYAYVTDPKLASEYEKAKQLAPFSLGSERHQTYAYEGGIYEELRSRCIVYQAKVAERLAADPDCLELTVLFLIEGTIIEPGFRVGHAALLFLFNVLLDFLTVTIAIVCIKQLGDNPTSANAASAFSLVMVLTFLCFTSSFLSYRAFFRGNTGVFGPVLLILPISVVAAILGLSGITSGLASCFKPQDYSRGEVIFSIILVLLGIPGFFGLRHVWLLWGGSSLGVIWHDLTIPPYILAATTLIPVTLTLIALGLALLAKLVAEPVRLLPWAYMTFVKEELGGTQASGIILLVSVLAGAVLGLIWTIR